MRFYKGSNHYVVALTCHKVRTKHIFYQSNPGEKKRGKYLLTKK